MVSQAEALGAPWIFDSREKASENSSRFNFDHPVCNARVWGAHRISFPRPLLPTEATWDDDKLLSRIVFESDVHRLTKHSGDDIHELVLKQMRRAGVFTWADGQGFADLHGFIFRSDRGSNMVYCRSEARKNVRSRGVFFSRTIVGATSFI